MHLAAALGVRVTAVFGPTNERETGPRGWVRLKPDTTYEATEVRLKPDTTYEATWVRLKPDTTYEHTVLTADVACRPCMLRECPIDHRCMRRVGVEAVLAEARRTL